MSYRFVAVRIARTRRGQETADFLVACGSRHRRLHHGQRQQRDAGYYQSIGRNAWWDATNATLPDPAQALLTWAKALAEEAGTGVLW